MVESKQVRVDNWGVFFLQRLQVFFSKTDYCDLTLQFEGNVQLKVHRLVMCACTDYFNYLEQSYPSHEESTIIMPPDLQADVIVPIVNFMYTGMLEFHMSIFERLYKAAELMSISVLMKLLDAQKMHLSSYKPLKKKSEPVQSWIHSPTPKASPKVNKTAELPPQLPGRKLPVWKRKSVPTVPMQHPTSQLQFSESRYPQDPLSIPDTTPKPTRFEWPDEDLPQLSLMDTSFEDISYTSKPLLTQEEEIRASTSFEEPRRNINIDHIKDDGESSQTSQHKRKLDTSIEKMSPKRAKLNDKENKEATISIKSSNGADLDHTKIVSEILKKYPQLVKKNKNIRLKIMASGNKNVSEQTVHTPVKTSKTKIQVETAKVKTITLKNKPERSSAYQDEGPWICTKCEEAGESVQEFVLYYLYRKHMTDVHSQTFDTRLCKYCGQWCGKHNLMMYHLYTKHGLKPPTTYNFPKCDQCPYIALSVQKLSQHKLRHNPNEMQCAECYLAFTSHQTLTAHIQITSHLNRNGSTSYDCQYCTKRLQSAINLFSHIKNSHLKEAKRDGIVILDESEDTDNECQEEDSAGQKDKVKIISNVKVPAHSNQTNIQQASQLEPSSEAEALSNVASGIATSLGLVDIVVLDDNQQYILQQEDSSGQPEFIIPDLSAENHFAGQVITSQHNTVLPQGVLQSTTADITSTDELVMVLTDHDYQDEQDGATADNSNIVVLYSHPVDGQQGQFITSQGNLLVNSQTGMLEIRNEPITPTAAGQVVMNAVDAPESIESIQREIDSHNQNEMKEEPFYEDEPKENLDQLEQAVVEDVVPETSEEQTLPVEESVATDTTNVDEQTPTKNLNEQCQEEQAPSEPVQDDGKKEKPDVEVITNEVRKDDQTTDNVDGVVAVAEPMETDETEEEETHNFEDTTQEPNVAVPETAEEAPQPPNKNVEEEGVDVPPQSKDYVENLCNTGFVDPSKIDDSSENNVDVVQEAVTEEMEVDGNVTSSKDILNTSDTTIIDENTNSLLKETEEEDDEQIQESQESKDSEKTEIIDIPEGASNAEQQQHIHEEISESEYQQQSETDNSQYNEEDENSQSSQDTSADNRNQGNINQAILEDWEDTDSQQSEKQRAVMKQAAENVNKLMDDWEEEEDEDDKRD